MHTNNTSNTSSTKSATRSVVYLDLGRFKGDVSELSAVVIVRCANVSMLNWLFATLQRDILCLKCFARYYYATKVVDAINKWEYSPIKCIPISKLFHILIFLFLSLTKALPRFLFLMLFTLKLYMFHLSTSGFISQHVFIPIQWQLKK